MSTITTNHLRLQYGERVIAEDLTIAFDKPEIVSIIGPNGSGKSTLLKSLARLLVPTGGAVYLDGQDLKDVSMDKIARTISALSTAPEKEKQALEEEFQRLLAIKRNQKIE